jgi:hypothetical protein
MLYYLQLKRWIAVLLALTSSAVACRAEKTNSFSPEGVEAVKKRNPPPLSEPCFEVELESGSKDLQDGSSLVSVAWEEGDFSARPEMILLSDAFLPLPGMQLCSKTPNTALFRLKADRITNASLLLRDIEKNKVAFMSQLVVHPGQILNAGEVKGQTASQIRGLIEGELVEGISGKILELDKTFLIQPNGEWSSGPLPPGRWSVVLKSPAGETLSWHKVALEGSEFNSGAARLAYRSNFVTPLWTGVLTKPFAPFALSTEEKFTEMRISESPTFTNSFWMPLRSVLSWPISNNGQQSLFFQFRTIEREISTILSQQFRAELAADLESADAEVLNPNPSMIALIDENLKNSSAESQIITIDTLIRTVPPAGALQHSVTLDIDESSRVWVDINAPLKAVLPLTPNSCGQHQLYIRFRDVENRETSSLRRPWNVRCWDYDIPKSPLAPRYDHGATAFKFCYNGSNAGDSSVSCKGIVGAVESVGIFIWGGRNGDTLFSDGAMLRKFKAGWRWDLVPSNSALTARANPQIVAGRHHILVWGGEDSEGAPVQGSGLFLLAGDEWLGTLPGNAPAPRLHPTASFVNHMFPTDSLYLSGMFVVLGGETKHPVTGLPSPSKRISYLYESQGGYIASTNWNHADLQLSASRAGFGLDASGRVLWGAAGLGAPSIESGTDPELNSQMFVLASSSTTTNGVTSPTVYFSRYDSQSSRTGSLFGHLLVVERYRSPVVANITDLVESMNPCVFGGQKYTDALQTACEVIDVNEGQAKAYQPFCRRLFDSYNFAPVGRRSVCFRPSRVTTTDASGQPVTSLYAKNFFLPTSGAPPERRLLPRSSASLPDRSNPRLFIWSGLAPGGGEFLADGSIYEYTTNSWTPVTSFESPAPRNNHSATAMPSLKRVFIFGGLTASGASSQGAFYALP